MAAAVATACARGEGNDTGPPPAPAAVCTALAAGGEAGGGEAGVVRLLCTGDGDPTAATTEEVAPGAGASAFCAGSVGELTSGVADIDVVGIGREYWWCPRPDDAYPGGT